MKTILFCSALIMSILCGCSERARQKAYGGGGDPALATEKDMKELKADIKEIKRKLEHL